MKTSSLFALSLTAVFSLSPIAKSFSQTTSVVANAAPAATPATVNRTVMLRLVNNVRKQGYQCGDTYYYPAPPVVWNSQLETAAYNHSANMAKNNFFSHYAPDGSRGGNRLERVGYVWKTYGENIGQGYKSEKEMVQGWLASPGHCKNIMNKNFTEMGVGRVDTLWTQEFGSR